MLAHRDLLILTLGVMILIGCGQQILKDEGLDSKSIGEAASSSEFKVDIVDPSDGETNVSTSSQFGGSGRQSNCSSLMMLKDIPVPPIRSPRSHKIEIDQ